MNSSKKSTIKVNKINFACLNKDTKPSRYSSLSERHTATTTSRSSLRKNFSNNNIHLETKVTNFNSPCHHQISEKELLNRLKEEKKQNMMKLQVIQNRIKSIEKQKNDYMRLLNIFAAKVKKEEEGRNFINEIKMKVDEAKKEKEMNRLEKQHKVQKLRRKENQSKAKIEYKRNYHTLYSKKISQTQKMLNNALYQEYKEHMKNINHSKHNKIDTDILQSKITNLNASINKKNDIKTKLQQSIIETMKENEMLKEELSVMEKNEEVHLSQLKETISKKNILRRHMYQSLDFTDYSDNYYNLTCCVTQSNRNMSRSVSRERKNFY